MGVRGNNNKTYALWEEISHLRVDVDAPPVQIYKHLDTETAKDVGYLSVGLIIKQ